jgi:hypothetical protein
LKTKNAGHRYREKPIEKIILRILASCAFSHSLDPFSDLARPPTPNA